VSSLHGTLPGTFTFPGTVPCSCHSWQEYQRRLNALSPSVMQWIRSTTRLSVPKRLSGYPAQRRHKDYGPISYDGIPMSTPLDRTLAAPASLRHRLYDWLPPILWMAVLFWCSTDTFAAEHTSSWLEWVCRWFAPHLTHAQFDILHFYMRKAAHFSIYACLAGLLMRAFCPHCASSASMLCSTNTISHSRSIAPPQHTTVSSI
jgi:hypothetical protein